MRKGLIRNISILSCVLLMTPGLAFAEPEENSAEANPDENVLDEVIVSSTPLEKYLVTTSVITAEEIEAKGARNVADALSGMPGLSFSRGKKNTNTLVIRGVAASYTKIYIDGVLVNGLSRTNSSSEVDLNQYSVDNIAKIEVIKGPAPVAYGTDAIGGIVRITTKDGVGFSGTKFSLSGGSDSTFNTNVSVSGGDKKFNYFVSAGTETSNGYTDHADQKGYNFNAKLNWGLTDDSSLTFIGGISHMNKYMPNKYDYRTGKYITTTTAFWPGLNGWEYRDWDKTTLALDYKKRFNDKFDTNIKIFRYTEDQEMRAHGSNYDSSKVTVDRNGNAVSIMNNGRSSGINASNRYNIYRWNVSPWESTVKGVEWDNNLKLNKIHTLSFGFMYHDIGWNSGSAISSSRPADPDYLDWSNDRKNKRYGYYFQDNITPNDRTMITLGVRHDKSKVRDSDGETSSTDSTNPTFNVVYQLTKATTMRASYGKTISFPLLSQYFGSNGNPNLKPEKSAYTEIGFKHEFDETFSADLAFFQNKIDDRITRKSDINDGKNFNITSTKIKGIEIGLDKKFSKKLSAYTSYTLLSTDTENVSGTSLYNSQLTDVPRHHFNYGLDYKWDNGFRLNLNGRWVTQRYTDDSGTGDTRDKSLGKIPYISGYHVMDMKLSKQVSPNANVYLSVYNLFDKQYEDSLFTLAPGRTFLMGVDYKL